MNLESLLNKFKIKKGDKIIVSSDLLRLMLKSKKKEINFDANNLIDILKKKIGKKGTLFIPTFNWDFFKGKSFYLNKSISHSGSLGNIALKRKDFLRSFKEYQRVKLFPIGVVPYAVIIKNNKDLIYEASNSWDFLLAEKLNGKIIFPQSPRILMSISKRISSKNSLSKLKQQAILFEDKNSINWLINSHASVAIIPFSLCEKYLRIDSRLSIVFPNKGVPLMWNFLLTKSKIKNIVLTDWIKSLDKRATIDELANQGWYLPFKNQYSQDKYNIKIEKNNYGPSKNCWENSWSFSPLNKEEQLSLEKLWNQSLTP